MGQEFSSFLSKRYLRAQSVGFSRHSVDIIFFRPSPSRLSPGRNTVFVPVERIVRHSVDVSCDVHTSSRIACKTCCSIFGVFPLRSLAPSSHLTHSIACVFFIGNVYVFAFVLCVYDIFLFGRRHLPFGWSPTLRLTWGPAGNRTTTGSLSALSKDTALPTSPQGRLFFVFTTLLDY